MLYKLNQNINYSSRQCSSDYSLNEIKNANAKVHRGNNSDAILQLLEYVFPGPIIEYDEAVILK